MMATYPPRSLSRSSRVPACPECGCIDQIQRVSAVYAAGRSTAEGMAQTQGRFANGVWKGDVPGGIGGSFRATTRSSEERATLLSQALAPPAEPLYTNPW